MQVFSKDDRVKFENELNTLANGDPIPAEWVESEPLRSRASCAYMSGMLADAEHALNRVWWVWVKGMDGQIARAKVKGQHPILAD